MKQEETNNVISIEEGNMDGKREETITASMKQQEVTVPDALKPEQIKNRLEKMETAEYESRRRAFSGKRIGRAWASAAAGIILIAGVMIGGSMIFHQNQGEEYSYNKADVSNQDSPSKDASVSKPEPEPKTKLVNDTYREAYEVIEEYQSRYYDDGDDIYYDEYDDYEEDTRTFGEKVNDAINGLKDTFTNQKKYESSTGESNYAAADGAGNDVAKSESISMEAPASDAGGEHEYSQNNVRTEGVEECNIVRTDGRYIYEYDENSSYINIYHANGADTSLAGEINLNLYEYGLGGVDGFYVADGILTISGTDSKRKEGGGYRNITKTLIYDVSNPSEPKFKSRFSQDGIYQESRMVGNIVYVFSVHTVTDRYIEEGKPEGYIPQFDNKLVPAKDLYIQQDCCVDSYTMISSIDVTACSYINKKSILGGIGKCYVSSNHIYLLDMGYTADNEIQLLRFTYKAGKLTNKKSGSIEGMINDDYSMDEYQGYLRLVTHYYDGEKGDYVNGLFIYDKKLRKVGSVKGIAKGEEIKSARFIGDTAYFVTYRNTDPLFAVDVSNPEKPKVLGYLKIPGFSTYLHPYGDGLLLGLGLETDEYSEVLGLKLSMYDISDSSDIKEIDKLVLPEYQDSEALYDANALLIDLEKNLIGFGTKGEYKDEDDYYSPCRDYLVYSYNKKQGFVRKLRDRNENYYDMKIRGLYIDDYFYVVNVGHDIMTYRMGKESFQRIKK